MKLRHVDEHRRTDRMSHLPLLCGLLGATCWACAAAPGRGDVPLGHPSAPSSAVGSARVAPSQAEATSEQPEPQGPFPPSSPTKSAAAAPAWARPHGYAPQPPNAKALFQGASAGGGAPSADGRGALACRVVTAKNTDFLSYPDLVVHAIVDGQPPCKSFDREGLVSYFTIPLVRSPSGAPIEVRIFDQDLTEKEPLATLTGKLGAWPLELRTGPLSLECRAISADQIDRSSATALEQLDAALAALRRLPEPVATTTDWGFHRAGFGEARRRLSDYAALLGWAHPRVQHRLRRLEQRTAAFRAATEELLAAWRAKAAPPSSPQPLGGGGIEATLGAVSCGAQVVSRYRASARDLQRDEALAEAGCVVELELRNRTPFPITTDAFMFRFGLLSNLWFDAPFPRRALARAVELRQGGRAVRRATVAPGESLTVVVTPDPAVDLGVAGGPPKPAPPASALLVDIGGNQFVAEHSLDVEYHLELIRLR